MVQQQYYTDPSTKHVQTFADFSGGLNSTVPAEMLRDNELAALKNQDLADRGATKRRSGMVKDFTPPVTGLPQGNFRYYRSATDFDTIRVVNGKVYVNGVDKTGTLVLQTTRSMEAVQYVDKLYIASGSGLLVYDGTNLAKVTPYTPQPMEALYVGFNGLASDPYNFMTDGTGTVLKCSGVTFNKRYGVVNDPITLSAWVNKPAGMTVEYKFESRKDTDELGVYTTDQDWSTANTYQFSTSDASNYLFKVSVRDQANTSDVDIYYVPKFLVKPASDPNDVDIDAETIDNCNRILLKDHRLITYGDTSKPDCIYISHLKNPAYFPMNNTERFDNPRNEGLTSIAHFRDMLIAQTPTSTQAFLGTSPTTYKRIMLNPSIGCIAPFSAKVFDNYLAFLSYNGITILKSLQYSDSRANVDIIDYPIQTEIPKDTDACAEVIDNQYHIVFPSKKIRYRFYTAIQSYAKDEGSKFDFARMYVFDNVLYGQRQDGSVLKFDPTAMDDDGEVFEDYLETKYFNFDMPFNAKKLREVQLHFQNVAQDTTINVRVLIDDVEVYNKGLSLVSAQEDPYKLQVAGKGQAIKVILSHSEAVSYRLLSMAFIYKLKKP